jgi:hypothetical protein
MTDGLTVFYLPRLNDDELAHALRVAFYVYDHAPRFCGWLVDALTAEQTARLQSQLGPQLETELLTMPFTSWTAADLARALKVANVLSYAVNDYGVGQLMDRIVFALQAAVGVRLRSLEALCQR